MYILFEEYQYESRLVGNILKDIYVLQNVNKKVCVEYVGYFYNPHLRDCVFILPKVLLTEDEKLSGVNLPSGKAVSPEQVLTPQSQEFLSKEYRKFIYEFSVWVYRALCVYHKANPKSKIMLYKHLLQIGNGHHQKPQTYLDVILSLIKFNMENRDFVLFSIKNLHQGNSKINWTATISHSQAVVEGRDVMYLSPITKKHIVDYEEELFVIYYSILNYLNCEYGFSTPINVNYHLISGGLFKNFLRGMGKSRLLNIKCRYFSDKSIQLWDLCYAFFDYTHQISINSDAQEYILAKSFDVVFESMVDELIGIPHEKIPKGLADQDDGKRVDHMYIDLALTSVDKLSDREVYYIGDSKYYKTGHKLSSESIYKQYTYARNVIQWNVNLFVSDKSWFDKDERNSIKEDLKRFDNIRLQDNSLTEGYDVVPNFFISSFVYNDHQYVASENIRKHIDKNGNHCTKLTFQYPDRLFDRDTLFLSHYDVNFLYVLYLYARNKVYEKTHWKKYVRRLFRDEIREVIQSEFKIYAMRAKQGVDGALYIKQHFYELNGRVFQPYGKNREAYFAYARPVKNWESTQQQYDNLAMNFEISECHMGDDPQVVISRSFDEELYINNEKNSAK